MYKMDLALNKYDQKIMKNFLELSYESETKQQLTVLLKIGLTQW